MSNTVREVVSFQLGHFANFVGTHCWNLQEATFVYSAADQQYPKEVNHDVGFREGKNLSGEITYTPRLISFDLKGSLNTLKQDGVLYDLRGTEEDLLWRNDVTLHKLDVAVQKNEFLRDLDAGEKDGADPEEDDDKSSKEADEADSDSTTAQPTETEQVFGNKYYNLDNSVKVWSDFLRLHLHPKSVHILEQYRHDDDAFDLYAFGEQLFRDRETKTEIDDRMHFFLEECDNMQGMQMFVDMYDGFGGLASAMVEELSDDYSNKSILIYSVTPTTFKGDSIVSECYRVLNTAMSLEKIASQSSMVIPLSLASTLWRRPGPARHMPHLSYKSELNYHSSAILGAAIENMSIPWRLESYPVLLPHLTGGMTNQGRKIACLQSSFPFTRKQNQYLVDHLWELGADPPWQCLTPYCSPSAKPWSQSVVLQGIDPTSLKGPPDPRLPSAVNNARTISDIMNLYLSDVYSTPLNVVHNLRRPCPVTTPFPHVFQDYIDIDGQLARKPRLPKTGVEEVPMMTSLQSSSEASNYISALVNETSKYNIKKFHKYLDNGLEEDSFREILENLKALDRCYRDEDKNESEDDYDVEENM